MDKISFFSGFQETTVGRRSPKLGKLRVYDNLYPHLLTLTRGAAGCAIVLVRKVTGSNQGAS